MLSPQGEGYIPLKKETRSLDSELKQVSFLMHFYTKNDSTEPMSEMARTSTHVWFEAHSRTVSRQTAATERCDRRLDFPASYLSYCTHIKFEKLYLSSKPRT